VGFFADLEGEAGFAVQSIVLMMVAMQSFNLFSSLFVDAKIEMVNQEEVAQRSSMQRGLIYNRQSQVRTIPAFWR